MKKLTLAALAACLLALPGSASASDPTAGETAFKHSCLRCHTARPAPRSLGAVSEEPGDAVQAKAAEKAAAQPPAWMGPDLVQVSAQKSEVELRSWMVEPRSVNPDTQCQSRLTTIQAADLAAYLRVLSRPLPLPKKQRVERSMTKRVEKRRAHKPRPGASGPPMLNESVSGGKKR